MDQTKIDTMRAISSHGTAFVVVLAGMLAIFLLPEGSTTAVIFAGFVGMAAQFLFGQETAKSASKATLTAANGHSKPPAAAAEVVTAGIEAASPIPVASVDP